MSTKRTVVNPIAIQARAGPKRDDLMLHYTLLRFEAGELVVGRDQRAQIAGHECAHRGAELGGPHPGLPVYVGGNRDRDVLHSITVSQ